MSEGAATALAIDVLRNAKSMWSGLDSDVRAPARAS